MSHGGSALFRLNQDLLALTAMRPATHAAVECFDFSRASERGSPSLARVHSAPVRVPGARPREPASEAHFPILAAAISSAFPDYDFSCVCPWNFALVGSPEQAQSSVNWAFQTQIADAPATLNALWATLEKEISPGRCAIYLYEPDRPDGLSESGAVFNLCCFFVNEKMGKVAMVHLQEGGQSYESDDEDGLAGGVEERYGDSVS
jgi:hypothetical protein